MSPHEIPDNPLRHCSTSPCRIKARLEFSCCILFWSVFLSVTSTAPTVSLFRRARSGRRRAPGVWFCLDLLEVTEVGQRGLSVD